MVSRIVTKPFLLYLVAFYCDAMLVFSFPSNAYFSSADSVMMKMMLKRRQQLIKKGQGPVR